MCVGGQNQSLVEESCDTTLLLIKSIKIGGSILRLKLPCLNTILKITL